jgi:hypothetical protein
MYNKLKILLADSTLTPTLSMNYFLSCKQKRLRLKYKINSLDYQTHMMCHYINTFFLNIFALKKHNVFQEIPLNRANVIWQG